MTGAPPLRSVAMADAGSACAGCSSTRSPSVPIRSATTRALTWSSPQLTSITSSLAGVGERMTKATCRRYAIHVTVVKRTRAMAADG